MKYTRTVAWMTIALKEPTDMQIHQLSMEVFVSVSTRVIVDGCNNSGYSIRYRSRFIVKINDASVFFLSDSSMMAIRFGMQNAARSDLVHEKPLRKSK